MKEKKDGLNSWVLRMEGTETLALESEGEEKGGVPDSREKGAGVIGFLRPKRTKAKVLDF